MPKFKTKKIITKRIRITRKGKVMRLQGFRRHLNAKKTSKRKRALKRTIELKGHYAKKIKKAVGVKKYGKS
jgi:large subunit ribosomal protein L35